MTNSIRPVSALVRLSNPVKPIRDIGILKGYSMCIVQDCLAPYCPYGQASLRPAEAAEAIGVGRSKVCELLASGELPSIRVGSSIRVPVDGLREWVAQQLASTAQDR